MNLDHGTVVVRERGFFEIYDLALALTRRHAGAIVLLGAIGCAPWMLLNWWLLAGSEAESIFGAFVLMAAEAPIATAPVTAYLGAAMFERSPRPLPALMVALRRLPSLATLALLRGAAAVTVIGLPFTPAHLVESLTLERQRLWSAWGRAWGLFGSWVGEHISHLIVATVVMVLVVAISLSSGAMAANLAFGWSPDEDDLLRLLWPGQNPLLLATPWAVIVWLSVVRFLAYIDLRTRREGWDIEIELRRAGRRLGGEGGDT